MNTAFEELKARLLESHDLGAAAAVLGWDQETYMPPGGGEARGRQLGVLGKLAHEKFIDPKVGELLEGLTQFEESQPYDSFEASFIRVAKRDYERAIKVPSEFVGRMMVQHTEANIVWQKARPGSDFGAVHAHLQKNFELARELADFFPGYEHVADPLIDLHDYGMKASSIKILFSELRKELVPIVDSITSQEPADDACLKQAFPEDRQLAFGNEVITAFGYDFERGRQDQAAHPFTTKFSIGDVRITTRVNPDHLNSALFGTMHEAGHAMYEQGIDRQFEGTPLDGGTSTGVHESQSRLWENMVGRSRGFWTHYYPKLQETFPGQLGSVPLETFYRAVNKVEPSLIRVEADEATYNLHIMMRFDFELGLLDETLDVSELPQAWNDRMEKDVGVRPPDDKDGVMQDIHWYNGIIGYFQGYSIGNILGAQFYDAALRAHPEIPDETARGKFDTLHTWLRENIYTHGSKFTANELIERVTGSELSIRPYINYLKEKYGELYDL